MENLKNVCDVHHYFRLQNGDIIVEDVDLWCVVSGNHMTTHAIDGFCHMDVRFTSQMSCHEVDVMSCHVM